MVTHLDLRHAEAAPLRHHRHETVELTIQLQMRILDHLATIDFKSIIDIMQVYASHYIDQAIEDMRRKSLRERIQAWKLPASHQIIALIQPGQETGDLLRIILQIAIHRKDDLSTTATKPGNERGRLAEIAAKAYDLYNIRTLFIELSQFNERLIRTSIIDKDYFITLPKLSELGRQLLKQKTYVLLLVHHRNNDR